MAPFWQNNIAHNRQQNSMLQNKFIRLSLRLPKYISVKLLHDSCGLPYVKDRLPSCATKALERISKNPLVEEPTTFNRVSPVWDRFPTPLSVIRPVSLQITMTYRGNFSEHPIAPKTGIPAHTQTCLAQSPDFKLQANTDYSASLPFSRCPMRLTNNWVAERSSQYLIHLVKFINIQPRNNNIKKKKQKKKKKNKTYWLLQLYRWFKIQWMQYRVSCLIGSFWRSLFSILAAKMVDEFSVEEKFSSFETLEKKILKSFESSSFVQLWKRGCRTVEAAKDDWRNSWIQIWSITRWNIAVLKVESTLNPVVRTEETIVSNGLHTCRRAYSLFSPCLQK